MTLRFRVSWKPSSFVVGVVYYKGKWLMGGFVKDSVVERFPTNPRNLSTVSLRYQQLVFVHFPRFPPPPPSYFLYLFLWTYGRRSNL